VSRVDFHFTAGSSVATLFMMSLLPKIRKPFLLGIRVFRNLLLI